MFSTRRFAPRSNGISGGCAWTILGMLENGDSSLRKMMRNYGDMHLEDTLLRRDVPSEHVPFFTSEVAVPNFSEVFLLDFGSWCVC